MRQSVYQSPLGPFYLWFANDRLIYASFNKGWGEKFTSRHFPQDEFSRGDLPQAYTHDLAAYFQGDRVEFDWPLLLLGTEFQKRVWHEISQIPHGASPRTNGSARIWAPKPTGLWAKQWSQPGKCHHPLP